MRALAEPAAGQDSNGMHRRHLALLGSRTGEARASVGTAPSSRHIRGTTWRRSPCGSGYRSGPVNRSAGQDAATRSRLAGYGSVPVAAKPADDILTVGVEYRAAGDVAAPLGHLQGGDAYVGRHAGREGPAHDHAGGQVDDGGEARPPLAGPEVGDVPARHGGGDGRVEPPADQVGARRRVRVGDRRPLRRPGTDESAPVPLTL